MGVPQRVLDAAEALQAEIDGIGKDEPTCGHECEEHSLGRTVDRGVGPAPYTLVCVRRRDHEGAALLDDAHIGWTHDGVPVLTTFSCACGDDHAK